MTKKVLDCHDYIDLPATITAYYKSRGIESCVYKFDPTVKDVVLIYLFNPPVDSEPVCDKWVFGKRKGIDNRKNWYKIQSLTNRI